MSEIFVSIPEYCLGVVDVHLSSMSLRCLVPMIYIQQRLNRLDASKNELVPMLHMVLPEHKMAAMLFGL